MSEVVRGVDEVALADRARAICDTCDWCRATGTMLAWDAARRHVREQPGHRVTMTSTQVYLYAAVEDREAAKP